MRRGGSSDIRVVFAARKLLRVAACLADASRFEPTPGSWTDAKGFHEQAASGRATCRARSALSVASMGAAPAPGEWRRRCSIPWRCRRSHARTARHVFASFSGSGPEIEFRAGFGQQHQADRSGAWEFLHAVNKRVSGHRISVTPGESRPAQAMRTWSRHGFGASPPDDCPRSTRSPMVVGS